MKQTKRIPTSKIKREFWRFVHQIDDALQRSFGRSFAFYYARYFVDHLVRVQGGHLDLDRRIAIYLIFPAKGLLESHRAALKYLIASGYAPVVVSNLPLNQADTAELLALSGRLILRPNFGLDFGGYRDAVRAISPNLPDAEYLAIFNDSSWFPIRPQLNWLADAEALELDFVGSASHDGMDSRDLLDFTRVDWAIDERAKRFHYGSYSLLFGPKLLRSVEFAKFWQDLVPTNSKYLTLRRGETGLTRWVIDNGFSHGATCETRHLDQLLEDLSTERLAQIADNLVTYDIPELTEMRKLARDPADPLKLRNVILTAVARHGPAYALIEFDTHERGGNFIKKAPMTWNREAAEATLRVLSQFRSPEAEIIRHEALAMYQATFGELRSEPSQTA